MNEMCPSDRDLVKMAIIVNVGADMSIGRLAAQVAHAATLALLKAGTWNETNTEFKIDATGNTALQFWMQEHFTKVVLKTWGAEEMHRIEREAKALDIPTALMIEDDGQVTALALGPVKATRLASITPRLVLL